jgi:endonuclease/exonuclease/phosphatase family metal-dependent hydrolase
MSKSMKFMALLILISSAHMAFAREVKIFSMNLHCGLGDWESRVDTVIREVLKRDPDIIGFQEVCHNREVDMTSFIIKKLKDGGYPVMFHKTAETHRTFLKYREQLLIITKLNVEDVEESWLPSMKFFENKYLAIKVDNFWAITSHFHFALPQIREEQFKVIAEKFSNRAAIIFGDLNSNPDNSETAILHEKNWTSFFGEPTYPSSKPDKTFDGFWASEKLSSDISDTKFEVLFKDEINPPSDHLGIYLKIDKI